MGRALAFVDVRVQWPFRTVVVRNQSWFLRPLPSRERLDRNRHVVIDITFWALPQRIRELALPDAEPPLLTLFADFSPPA